MQPVLRLISILGKASTNHHWFHGLTVMTVGSDPTSEGSTPSGTFLFS